VSSQQVRSFSEALSYLYSFTDFEQKQAHLFAAANFDLGRVHDLLRYLDNPHHRFKSIHLAGTKGKGSTAAITAAVLRAAGFCTGLYTSPHLHSFCERIRVDAQMIARDQVRQLVHDIAPAVESVPLLTTFEIITALAFMHFARQGVEFAVIEVGLGGRLDATNVIQPCVTALTSLSLDHTYVLGDTVAAIAREKGGIIKPSIPVVSAPQAPEALAIIEAICRERGAPLTVVGRDWTWQPGQASLDGQTFSVVSSLSGTDDLCQRIYRTPLLGRHQLINATVSIASLHALRGQGVDISADNVAEGLSHVVWPARFEVLSREPALVVDGAHNVDSAKRLREALNDYFPGREATLIFGVSADKDVVGMLRELLPVVRRVIVTQSRHPRAASARSLAPMVSELGRQALIAEDAERALDMALDLSASGSLICATGSLFVAGDIRLAWMQRSGVQNLPLTDD
jgi:dihydrofolate synthase/folylpolyglutamate synthase